MADRSSGLATRTLRYKALVTDFDGVHTDNSVFVLEDGREFVRCSRADGMGLEMLRSRGLRLLILSREENAVVSARARKLRMEVAHNIKDKLPALDEWRRSNDLEWSEMIYIGDDVNDLDCMKACGLAAAPANARPEILAVSDVHLKKSGGDGALRELSDYLISNELV
ncbi:KdsC family phosphatase [Roseibium sediminis]|uniref:KdsC family phosphatase n=1 Tax=Roseibium sediminis TaxID=1775174 RepID=UPI00123CA7F9|nr:HAD hydrolase family protein [Roseibium sediminis]